MSYYIEEQIKSQLISKQIDLEKEISLEEFKRVIKKIVK